MHTTPASLLERLRRPDEHDAWLRFVQLYTPLLCFWARRVHVPAAEIPDLVQEVFVVLVRKFPDFNYDPDKSFRAWLQTLTVNKWRELQRRQRPTVSINGALHADVAASADGNSVDDAEYRSVLAARALQLMRTDFEPTTWQACWKHTVEGTPAKEVATQLGISPAAVYVAKARVLSRLRQELKGLID